MCDFTKALRTLKSWKRRDDNDNGFSKNTVLDAEQVLHSVYDKAVEALEYVIKSGNEK